MSYCYHDFCYSCYFCNTMLSIENNMQVINDMKISDLDQRLVSGFSEPFDPPLGVSAASLPFNTELTHPCDSLQSVLQVLLADVHRQT